METPALTPETTTAPQLAAPGAGLPGPERFVGNLILRWQSWRTPRAGAETLFAAQRARVLELVDRCDPGKRATPVLIPRLRGMEDSSRFWSVLMTVDHLRIVNHQITTVITSLAAGQVPARRGSTAAVKPDPRADGSVVARFEAVNDAFIQAVAAIPDLKTQARFAHPWFGPLHAAQWHFLAGFHMRLHVRQMEAILAGLGA